MAESLDVHLYGTAVGRLLRATGDAVVFESSRAGMDRFGVGSRVLSQNLPLGPRPSSPDAATAFFGGLMPEGTGLTILARQAGVRAPDLFGLVSYAGRDVAGALVIGDPPAGAGRYEPLDDVQVAERIGRINDYAFGAVGGGGSLAGYQPKTTLALLDGTWHAGIDGAASTHILKPAAPGSEDAVHAEAYCLELARRCGLTSFASGVHDFAGRTVLVIERYDRKILPDGTVARIHQEDGAQALGLPWRSDAKFEGVDPRASLRSIAALLPRPRALRGGPDQRQALLAYTAFNTAVGNTDAHAKNFSVLRHEDGSVALAPLYDASAHALRAEGNQNLALKVGGKAYQPDITREDLIAEGASWGLDPDAVRQTVEDTLEKLRDAVEDTDPGAAGERVGAFIAHQADNLLDGRRAGAGTSGPPALAQYATVVPRPGWQGRVPRGVSTGGRFTGDTHAEPDITLG